MKNKRNIKKFEKRIAENNLVIRKLRINNQIQLIIKRSKNYTNYIMSTGKVVLPAIILVAGADLLIKHFSKLGNKHQLQQPEGA